MNRLKPEPLTEADIRSMELLWRDYERTILWKKQKAEEHEHEMKCKPEQCLCKSYAEELTDWEDYAIVHWTPKLPELNKPAPQDKFDYSDR